MRRKLQLSLFLLTLSAACVNTQSNSEQKSSETTVPEIITLTQTGCQFLETEGKDYEYQTTKAEDCNQINKETLSERKESFKALKLKPGKYTFRVTNKDVPYELGFYLRGEGVTQVTLPKVSGGGLNKGDTQDYQITLKPGKYLFSCPLNPTPDYPITVQ